MDRPVHLVALSLGLLVLTGGGMGAEETPSPEKRVRAISPRVADILTTVSPRFETPAVDGATADGATPSEESTSRPRISGEASSPRANTIIRLPEYLVRERKPRPLPKLEEIMSPREIEKLAMLEFIGSEDGIDRGFLNLFTVPGFWKKIPLLGRIPLAVWETNEERGTRMYRADREAKAWAEAMGLLSPMQRAGIATPTGSAPQPKVDRPKKTR